MRPEHVTLQDVDISQLYDEMKKYLKNLKLDIIHGDRKREGNNVSTRNNNSLKIL